MAFSLFKVLKGLLIKEENTLTPKEIQITPGGSAGTKTSIVSSQTSNVTVTIPNGTTTLVGHDLSQTLTNKTIDADLNTLSNIENADIKSGAAIDASKLADGSVSNSEFQQLNGVTSSVVGVSDTQTLTNKTIDADLNTISNIENADIKTGAAIDASKLADGSVSNAEFQYLGNVTSDIQTQLNSKASSGDLSTHTGASSGVHGVTGSVVGTSDSQTLTNKTIDADLNTITNIENADIKVGAAIDASKIANGSVSNSEFQQLDGLTSPAVGTTQTQTLTNKTLTSPVINDPTVNVETLAEQSSTPSTPASGFGKLYFKNDGNIYALNDGGSETQLGGSGQGGINYISNYKADSTTGWNIFNDGSAGGVPTDGTGGTGTNITFTTVSSTALRGSKVFRLTDSNRSSSDQQGVSYDFSIDAQDKNKAIKIAFDYIYTNDKTNMLFNDLLVYIYDKTNATIISPYADSKIAHSSSVVTNTGNIIKQISTPERFELSFPAASNSTEYRLIIFCLSGQFISGSGSAVLDFTDVLVTPFMNKMLTLDKQDSMVDKAPNGGMIGQYDGNYFRIIDDLGGYVKLDGDNFIKRQSKAQTGTWLPYDDGSAAPVDGTGGTFGGTFNKTATANILDGINSFSIATTNIGEGVARSFTIDNAYKARVLNVSFDYHTSGTGAEGDWQVWIYDTTNGVLIQPSNYKLSVSSSTTIMSRYNAVFQASTSATYRILLHKTTTNALTLVFDNVVVSPVVQPSTTLITEWQTYTPTFTNFGTVTVHEAYYRRVGGTLELDIKFTPGTTVGAEARVSFPTGLTSRTLANGIRQAGSFTIFNNTTTAKVVPLVESGVTYLTFGNQDGASGFTKMNATSAFSTGNPVAFRAEVQIAGWNTNSVSSSLDDGRVVDFVGYVASNQALTADVTNVALTAYKDSHGAWNGSQYTVPVAGDYLIGGNITYTSSGTHSLKVWVNGVLRSNLMVINSSVYGNSSTIINDLKAGDVVSLRDNGTITTSADTNQRIYIQRIAGPQTITATETIAASYYLTTSGTYSTTAPINMTGLEYDTHLAVTTGANWKFTAPAPGLYSVGGSVDFSTGATVVLYKNGTAYKRLGYDNNTTDGSYNGTIRLLAGDYIDIRPGASVTVSGSATLAASPMNINIVRLGI